MLLGKLEEARAELLDRVVEIAEQQPGLDGMSREGVRILLRHYYRHAAPDDLSGRNPVDVYGAAMSHRQLAAHRPQGTANVRVYTPVVDEHGWSCGHTVVEVVTDDMPFLVDSVTAEVTRQGRAIHLVIHPQMHVRRNITGELLEICDQPPGDEPVPDVVTESWMHVEIDRETDPGEWKTMEDELRRVLRDVREAVEDWGKMHATALAIADDLSARELPLPSEEVAEAWELLRWLAEDHFTFLGYREYELAQDSGEDVLRAKTGSGLGILRSDQVQSHSFSELPPEVRAKARQRRLLVLTKAASRATVHRPSYLDYVGVKKFDEQGEVVGEHRFLGLFSHAAYTESVLRIPVLRRKAQEVIAQSGFTPDSHSGKDLMEFLETHPRDELFQIPTDELLMTAFSVLHIKERRQLRLFLRRDEYGRFVSALVYLPRDRYNTEVRGKMSQILKDELHGVSVDYTSRVSESVLARLHFTVLVDQEAAAAVEEIDQDRIEQRLADATRQWRDDFQEALIDQMGEGRAAELMRRYAEAFPAGYRETFPARVAVADLKRFDELSPSGGLAMNLYEPIGSPPGERRFKVYRTGAPLSLTDVLPVLQEMGVEVIDEHPYEIVRSDGNRAWIYDFGLRYATTARDVPIETLKTGFQETFAAVWSGHAESDGFNSLVLRGGLTWRQAVILRAYAKYLRQGGTTFSQDYIEQVLVSNVQIARLLVKLFEARFDPRHEKAAGEVSDALVEEINGALDQVASLDADRILRSFLTLMQATLRTNYFRTDPETGAARPYVSFKLDPQAIPDLPAPRPKYEVWVYSPRVEGVHLRFGSVARGGLRWSDRREDFRTEILGLVKAQMVKNAVIVPVGAKGGFVCKQLPDASDREAWLAEGVSCYKLFISGLLDITDNLVGGRVVPPPQVVRHDGDDSYLVVAADKGTATFSDIANGVSKDYGFWLGDAFASGGSAGYDHKAMGITARGAWESVKRHFREMGVDCQREDFTVVGVGDMSGDVFGNGMLLSEHIRLVAAFDHRHIFLDPDPDSATSYAERRRMFALPRSSWADYDESLISAGGGVYPRTAKSIPITPEVKAALGIAADVTRITPNELMHAILAAPVDLFWNGGIGTYVKSSAETHAEVGDKANDAIRVDGSELRVKCVGEGGNLGLTQLGRIEYALAGGRVCTDAIDNSAGVDCSDHEVNIKVLLDRVVADGDMTEKQRNILLAEMTDEVATLVLRDNYAQNVAMATAVAQAPSLLHAHARYIRRLEKAGQLDRELEFLPADKQINERRQAGLGLVAPEFAVLLAYTKITLDQELLQTALPDEPYLRQELFAYFPSPLRSRFREQIEAHPLRREIINTCLVNSLVNTAGTTFVYRMREETGSDAEDIFRAHVVVRDVFGLPAYWAAVEALDNAVDAVVQTRMRLEARRLAERGSRWLLHNRRPPIDIAAQIEFFHDGALEVLALLPKLLRGDDLGAMQQRRDELVGAGIPEELAVTTAVMDNAYSAFDIVAVSRDKGRPVDEVADVYFSLADRLSTARLLGRINALPRDDRWKTMARGALREDLYAAHAGLTSQVLSAGGPDATPDQRFAAWVERNGSVVNRARQTFEEIATSETYDLAMMSVAMRTFRTLLRSGSMS